MLLLTVLSIVGVFCILIWIRYRGITSRKKKAFREGQVWLGTMHAKSTQDVNTYQLGNLQFQYSSSLWCCRQKNVPHTGSGPTPQKALQHLRQQHTGIKIPKK